MRQPASVKRYQHHGVLAEDKLLSLNVGQDDILRAGW
jgi:hypothetical protein